jgi:hypothetical protein
MIMVFSVFALFAFGVIILVATTTASDLAICHNQYVSGLFCTRLVFGHDITGVTNMVKMGPMSDACDCLDACIEANATCTSFVWKYTSKK